MSCSGQGEDKQRIQMKVSIEGVPETKEVRYFAKPGLGATSAQLLARSSTNTN